MPETKCLEQAETTQRKLVEILSQVESQETQARKGFLQEKLPKALEDRAAKLREFLHKHVQDLHAGIDRLKEKALFEIESSCKELSLFISSKLSSAAEFEGGFKIWIKSAREALKRFKEEPDRFAKIRWNFDEKKTGLITKGTGYQKQISDALSRSVALLDDILNQFKIDWRGVSEEILKVKIPRFESESGLMRRLTPSREDKVASKQLCRESFDFDFELDDDKGRGANNSRNEIIGQGFGQAKNRPLSSNGEIISLRAIPRSNPTSPGREVGRRAPNNENIDPLISKETRQAAPANGGYSSEALKNYRSNNVSPMRNYRVEFPPLAAQTPITTKTPRNRSVGEQIDSSLPSRGVGVNPHSERSEKTSRNNSKSDKDRREKAYYSRSKELSPARDLSLERLGEDKLTQLTLKKLMCGRHAITLKELSKNRISNLDLTSGDLSDSDLAAICKLLGSAKALKSIKLSKNKISDEGLSYLCYVLLDSSIGALDLSSNSISQEGLPFLLKLIRTNKKIRSVNLKRNDFSQKSREKIIQDFKSLGCVVEL